MSQLRAWLAAPGRIEVLVRAACVVACLGLAGRFWHPFYGFTSLLQLDTTAAADLTPRLRGAPLFTYPAGERYDGAYYAQIASDPTLRDPALGGGIDTVEYRARRILGPALAHVLAGGDPVRATRLYASLNLVAWVLLAALLWRLLPPGDWRRTAAWIGVLGSAGALHSVRYALADLPALAALVGGVLALERRRLGWAALAFALAALSRETSALAALAAGGALWRSGERRGAAWVALGAALPIVVWVAWLRVRFGGGDGGGWDNFDVPLAGWVAKVREATAGLAREGDKMLAVSTLLAAVGLTGQVVYFFVRRQTAALLWWIGAAFAGLALTLDVAVWEGHPGAATRVLLPLTLAFFVLAARERAAWRWLALGALTLPAAVLPFGHVPGDAHELSAGKSYLATTSAEFDLTERHGRRAWAWARTHGELTLRRWPRDSHAATVTLELRAPAPRVVTIAQGDQVLWSGEVGTKRLPVRLPAVAVHEGAARLVFSTTAAPVREAGAAGRELGFAVYDVRVE